MKVSSAEQFDINIDKIMENNIVLKSYGELIDKKELCDSVNLVFDVRNHGFREMVSSHSRIILEKDATLNLDTCQDLLSLTNFEAKQKIAVAGNEELFYALNKNLSKNSTDLRKATLKVLIALFETEHYLNSDTHEANVDTE